MYIYIYILYVFVRAPRTLVCFADTCIAKMIQLLSCVREDSSTQYGLWFSAEIYGRKRFPTNTYRKLVLLLRKSPETSGSLRENVIYRHPALQLPLDRTQLDVIRSHVGSSHGPRGSACAGPVTQPWQPPAESNDNNSITTTINI